MNIEAFFVFAQFLHLLLDVGFGLFANGGITHVINEVDNFLPFFKKAPAAVFQTLADNFELGGMGKFGPLGILGQYFRIIFTKLDGVLESEGVLGHEKSITGDLDKIKLYIYHMYNESAGSGIGV